MNMSQNSSSDGYYIDTKGGLMVDISLVQDNPNNPRDPKEIDYDKDPAFRTLVENMWGTEKMNHTPIQVYKENGHFGLIAGHRRLAALKKINEFIHEEWEKTGNKDEGPEVKTHIFATLMPTPNNELEKRKMMFSAEETSKRWGDVRKFIFFKDMVKELPKNIQKDSTLLVRTMQTFTGMPASTVQTYCSFILNPPIAEAMASLQGDLPRAGRMKMIRACDRGVNTLINEHGSLVRQLTRTDDDAKARQLLAEMFLLKLRSYQNLRKNGLLSIGPGVAMERTIAELRNKKNMPSNEEVAFWLTAEKEIFRQAEIEQTSRRLEGSGKAHAVVKNFTAGLPSPLSKLPVEELQGYADDLTNAADHLNDKAKQVRDTIRRKNT